MQGTTHMIKKKLCVYSHESVTQKCDFFKFYFIAGFERKMIAQSSSSPQYRFVNQVILALGLLLFPTSDGEFYSPTLSRSFFSYFRSQWFCTFVTSPPLSFRPLQFANSNRTKEIMLSSYLVVILCWRVLSQIF